VTKIPNFRAGFFFWNNSVLKSDKDAAEEVLYDKLDKEGKY